MLMDQKKRRNCKGLGLLPFGMVVSLTALAAEGNDRVAGEQLIKTGAGYLGVSGNHRFERVIVEEGRLLLAGRNTFDQASHVDGGRLYVVGTLSGPQLHVGSAGQLGGWGVIAAATHIEGTLEAGAFGAPIFTRGLTLASGSTTQVEMGLGHALRIQGPEAFAQLGGTLQVISRPGRPAVGDQWLLQSIDGASVRGGFDALQQPEGLREQGLRYDLGFSRQGVALTLGTLDLPTQARQHGNALQATQALNALRDKPIALRAGAYNDWLQASLGRGHLGGLERTAGGQVYADGLSYLSRQSALLDHMMFRELGQAVAPGTSNVWFSGLSSNQTNDGRQGIQSSSERTTGLTAGLTHPLTELTRLAGSVTKTEGRIASAGGRLLLDTTQLGLGVHHAFEHFDAGPYVAGNIAGSHVETRAKRTQAGFGTAKGNGTASQFSATLRSGYRWNIDGWALEPHLGLNMATAKLGNVREKGSDLALDVKAQTQKRTSLVSGAKASRNVRLGDWLLTPALELGHNRVLAGATARTQAELYGVGLDQRSANSARDSLTAGLALSASQGALKTTLGMQGAKGGGASSNGASLAVAYRF